MNYTQPTISTLHILNTVFFLNDKFCQKNRHIQLCISYNSQQFFKSKNPLSCNPERKKQQCFFP